MYRLGYIDDEKGQFENIKNKIRRYNKELELCWIQGSSSIQNIVYEVYKENADVLLIDYKMAKVFGFNGSKLVSRMNDYISDLPCFILTQVDKNEIKDGLVEKRNIISKTVFDTEDNNLERINQLKVVLDILEEAACVFRNRMKDKVNEYLTMLIKKEEGSLQDERRFIKLYQVLSSYDLVEKLPDFFLENSFQNQLNELIQIGKTILEKHEG